jgi:hypothetical protein
LLKLLLQKIGAQFFGERGTTTPAYNKTLVPALSGTAERPFVSEVIVAAPSTARDGLTHLVMEMPRVAVGGMDGVSQKCL